MTGVVSTMVGYAGGIKKNPTYHDLGDQTETIQIEFDPGLITYQDLLQVFWDSHDATMPRTRQYRSLILSHSEEQQRLALASREREQSKIGRPIVTEIKALTEFTPAEGYHQKYWLRQMPELMSELRSAFATEEDMLASTAAARLNGLVGGYGSPEAVVEAVRALPSGKWKVLDRIARTSST